MIKTAADFGGLIEDFVALLFPSTCLYCRQSLLKNENGICTSCQINLPTTNYHLSYNDNPLFNDLKIIQNITLASAYLRYHKFGIAQALLHELKYRGNYEVGKMMGAWYASHIESIVNADIILPVPIHQEKIKKRGYNQSVAIAEGLQTKIQLPIDTKSIIRCRKTKTQTKKSKVERWLAIEAAFEVTLPEYINGKNILIVDDVITTGSTIFSLCDQINLFEPKSLQVIAMATGK